MTVARRFRLFYPIYERTFSALFAFWTLKTIIAIIPFCFWVDSSVGRAADS